MGFGIRVFYFDEGKIARIPFQKFDRMNDRNTVEALPEHAGKRLRCAMVLLNVENRKPVSVRHIDYLVMPLDSHGRVDHEEVLRSASFLIGPPERSTDEAARKVIEFRPYLSKHYREKCRWTPHAAERETFMRLLF